PLLFPVPEYRSKDLTGPLDRLSASWSLPFDVFGATFYIASGQWEVELGRRDRHGRVLGRASFLERAGFADVPVIHYYAGLVRRLFCRHGMRLGASRAGYRRVITCDVDRPHDAALYEPLRLSRRVMRNVLLDRNPLGGLLSIQRALQVYREGWKADPNNSFDWMAEVNEAAGNQLILHMLAGGVHELDGSYSLNDSCIVELGQRLSARGHRFGL